MNVRVNGRHDIIINPSDDNEKIKIKIAFKLNTLPRYLDIPDEEYKGEVKVEDLLDVIKNYARDASKLFSSLQTIIIDKLDYDKDVWPIWTVERVNKIIEDVKGIDDFMKDAIITDAKNTIITEWKRDHPKSIETLDMFWNNQVERYKVIQRELKAFKKQQTEVCEIEKISLSTNITSTDFRQKKITYRAEIKTEKPLIEMFNDIVLNGDMPVACYKNYYKILKDFIPPNEWNLEEQERILLKLRDGTDVIIYNQKFITLLETTLTNNIDLDKFKETISIVCKIDTLDLIQIRTQGIFFFPNREINIYVLSDIIMNDTRFSGVLNSDESLKATKKKRDEKQPWLYLHYGKGSASITQKKVEPTDAEIRLENPNDFKPGSGFLRVNVKGENINYIKEFKELLNRLLTIYDLEECNIISFYKKFISSFGEKPKPKKVIEKKVKFPFGQGYTRQCQKGKQPIELNSENETVIRRLLGDKVDIGISEVKDISGNSKRYACGVQRDESGYSTTDYPFIRLRPNNDKKNPFPEVPCCFKEEQKSKVKSQQQNIIKTRKILANQTFGVLPPKLNLLFGQVQNDVKYQFVRYGIREEKNEESNSIINALNMVMSKNIKRRDLINNVVLTRQSLYDRKVEEIIADINDDRKYIDPRLYITLLEYQFKCNIFVFSDDGFILPRSREGFYKYNKEYTQNVFMYENPGTEFGKTIHPQCELIGKWDTELCNKDNVTFLFNNEDGLVRSFKTMLNTYSKFYVDSKSGQKIKFPLEPVSQFIDCYGKTRMVTIIIDGKPCSLLTSPIPPLNIVDDQNFTINYMDSQKVITFLDENKLLPLSQVMNDENKLIQVNTVIGNVNVSIPIKDGQPLDNVPVTCFKSYPNNGKSELDRFTKNKRIARYLSSYAIKLFSQYVNDKQGSLVDLVNFFIEKEFTIDNSLIYDDVPKNDFNSNIFLSRLGKLKVTNDIKNRLKYILTLASIRTESEVRSYKDRKTIPNYYYDITDLDKHSTQVLLQDKAAVEQWKREYQSEILMFDKINPDLKTPYFFLDRQISPTVCLVHNASSIEEAVRLASNSTLPITYSVYVITDEVSKYRVTGDIDPPYEVKIVISRNMETDVIHYAALIELDKN